MAPTALEPEAPASGESYLALPKASASCSRFALLIVVLLGSVASAPATEPHVVEELTFRVDPAAREVFRQHDAAIWTAVLEKQPGFLDKEIWLSSEAADEVKLVIRWRSRKDWNAVPKAVLAETDKRFRAAMGDADWAMVRGRAFRAVAPTEAAAGVSIDGLLNREALLSAVEVGVAKDPVYFRPKRYLAVPIHQAVETLVPTDAHPASLEVVFDCTDDYHSRMPLADFLAGDPWLAFRDLDAPDGQAWFKNPKGPPPKKMGRACIVWRGAERPDSLAWPYAVERIRLLPAK